MASKGPEAFRTISEVADELDLPQHVLRFWETRFTQIRPMKRGGGRRYYRPDDVDLLRGIRHLLYGEGYTIRGVQRLLKEHGPRFVTGAGRGPVTRPRLEAEEHELEDEIDAPPINDEFEEADETAEDADEDVTAEAGDDADGDTDGDEVSGEAEESEDEESDKEDESEDGEEGDEESDDEEEDEAEESAPPRHIEPRFDPKDFRPRPLAAKPAARGAPATALSAEDVRRLQSTLTDLLNLKRLLDQARD